MSFMVFEGLSISVPQLGRLFLLRTFLVFSLLFPLALQAETPTKSASPELRPQSTPLSFVQNTGHEAGAASYLAHGPGYAMKLFPGRVELSIARPEKRPEARGEAERLPVRPASPRLEMELLGADRAAAMEGARKLPGVASYFIGSDPKQWRTALPTYGELRYKGIYRGIDLSFHGVDGAQGQRLEYDFALQPGARPGSIAIALRGAESVELDDAGNLALAVHGERLRFLKPVAWQGSQRRPVDVSYRLTRATERRPATVTFHVEGYNPKESLLIDPVLVQAGYLDLYSVNAMTTDSSGNVYLVGQDATNSNTAFDVLKFNSSGTLVYTDVIQANTSGTYGYGFPSGIAVDASGHAFVAGAAAAGWPTTSGAYQKTNGYASAPTYTYDYNAYLVELNTTGTGLMYGTYLGGSGSSSIYYTDYAFSVALDSAAKAYLLGTTHSTNFPTTTGAYQTKLPADGGAAASFVAKIDTTQTGAKSLVYSTLLGDQDTTEYGIAVDSLDNAYVTGYADSYYNLFPITSGALSYDGASSSNAQGAYVTKLNASGAALVYSAYLGYGTGVGIAVDGSGDAYVTGVVNGEDFPTTTGAYQTNYPGGFVSELNPAATAFIYSTFLSGPSGVTNPNYTTPNTIVLTPGCASACAAYVAGISNASPNDLPQVNSIETTPGSNPTGFVVGLNGTGTAATLSTYISGIADQTETLSPSYVCCNLPGTPAIALDASGNVYYAANISTPDFPASNAPTTAGYSPYLAKIGPAAGGAVAAYPLTVPFGTSNIVNTSSNVYNSGVTPPTVTLRNMGSQAVTLSSITSSSSSFSETNTCAGAIPAGGQCVMTPVFTPAVSGTTTGTLSIASTGAGSPLTVKLSGTASDGGYLEVLQPSNSQLNFGTQAVGTASAFQTIAVKNTGDQPITSLSIQNLPAGFATLNNCPATLNAGASCEFGIQFAPFQAGFFDSGSPYIYSPTYGSYYGFTVTGIGVISGNQGSLALSAAALNFDTLSVGTASGSQYVSIKNTGIAPVGVLSYTTSLTGTVGNAADFAINSYSCGQPPYVIQPESSCSFYVTFTPSAAGAETATIAIANSTGAAAAVALAGTGSADTQKLVFTPSNYVFPDQVVGVASAAQTFYVENSGDQTTTIDRVFAAGDFRLQPQSCTGALAPSNQPGVPASPCSVSVVFDPSVTGNRTGSLTFVDTGAGTAETLSLSGNGIVGTGALVADTPSLTFPAQAVGTTSAYQNVTFTSPGNTPITLNSSAVTGDFSAVGYSCSLPYSLGVGQSCTWQIAFTPTSATNPRNGTFTLNSSAGPIPVALTGTGETASQAVGLTPAAGSTLSFGSVQTGTTSTLMYVYLHNVGTDPVTISTAPTVTGAFSVNNEIGNGCGYSPTILQPGQECLVTVQFSPVANGAATGTLTFTDTAGTQKLTVTGTGTSAVPATYFTPAALTLPLTPVGIQTEFYNPYVGPYVYFYNNGTSALTIASAQVTAGGSSYYISPFTDNCTDAVIPSGGGSCGFQVYFAPTAAGYETGTVTLTDTTNKTYTMPLYGYAPAVLDSGYLAPAALAFPNQALGTTSTAAPAIILTNTGSTTMNVGTISGVNLGSGTEFPVNSDGCSQASLVPLTGSCAVNLQFAPSAAGARSGQLSLPVTYSDGTAKTFTANLTGTGGADVNKAVLSPTGNQYPDTVIGAGSGSYSIPFTLSNVGTVAFTVGSLSGVDTMVGASTTGDFTTNDGCSVRVVQPGSSCAVYVYFYPLAGAAGLRSGSLTFPVIYSGAGSITSFTATYSGNAVLANKSLVVTPAAAQLGTWIVATHSTQSTITLQNNGNVPISLGTPSVTSPFALSNSCGAQLAENATCTIAVIFTPTATGAASGTLTIPSNAPGSPVKVALSGTGILASQQLAFSQSAVAFGSQLAGTTSNTVVLSLVNQSSLSVAIKSISLSGANVADFTESNDTCTGTTLYGLGAVCTIDVEFTPGSSAIGAFTAGLNETDTGTGGPRSVALTGTSIHPTPAAGLFPTSLSFSRQTVGVQSASQSFSVTNTGSGPLKITTVASTGSSEFSITSNACTGTTLAVGADCLVSVAFDPTLGGTRPGQITVTDNAAGSPQLLPLSGLGYGIPKATLSATTVTAPSVDTGKTSTAPTVTLTDNGTDTLIFSSFSITGANAAEFSQTNTCGSSIAAPTGSCTITLTFAPTAAGAQTAILNITDNAGNVPGAVQQITLNGTGIGVPKAVLSASTLTFAAQGVGTPSPTQSVTLSNPGTAALSIAGVVLGGTDPGDYSESNTCGTSLAIGANCSLTVTFKPTTTGSRPATLTITDNAGLVTGSTQTVSLAGTGIPLAAAPTFSPAAGTYSTTQSVALSDATAGAAIYYTTNGTTPTTASTKYTAGTPISVSATETIQAIATATGFAQSPVASATYTITPPAAAPTAKLPGSQ
jgi:hypothetical protein